MKKTLWVLYFVILLSVSCGRLPEEYPSDFSLTLDWNTGALPPQYHYQYIIAIGPGPQADFAYQPGYDQGSELAWATSFDITESNLQSLYTYLKDNNLMREKWQSGQPLLGGQGTSIRITAYGKQFQVPSVSAIRQSDRALVESAIEMIRSFVPKEIWDEMDARQSQYENAYGE